MKKCLNCEKQIDLVGDFCSDLCSEIWQSKNQSCSKCHKDLNLLDEEYTIKKDGEKSLVLCQTCGHASYVE